MYDYRFDIREFKTIDPIVLPYKGRLEPGWMYVDSFDSTNENRLKLSEPLKMSLHHAARIEWLNTGKFPKLRAAGRTFITFRVVSREIKKIGDNRWNDTYTLRARFSICSRTKSPDDIVRAEIVNAVG